MELMGRATRANIECRYRVGALLELPAEGEVMITGDLHGNRSNFLRIVRTANLSSPRRQQRHLVLQELVHEEDIPRDAACRSYQLVEMAARLKVTFPDRVHLLLGNHEFAELNDLPIAKHGVELNELFREGLMQGYGERWQEVREVYKEFWRSLPLAAVTPGGAFICHSTPPLDHMEDITREYLRGLKPGEGLTRKSPAYYLVWGRDYSAQAADKFAEQVDVGVFLVAHAPCHDGYGLLSHRHVALDCSADTACYLVLPLGERLTSEQGALRVRRLSAPSPRQDVAQEPTG
jgi:hypothetical protein